ncbi:asparagine synthase (glutamine-hydrolyzing) [Hippea sp. KM1]|uniref:asparagine synthase (glutamine-hydrolyzing) n=1 Tax=Hippea sp. KM1 TaxID=944481 RepID=UPI00046D55CA|nr:asparagine synthase (glutamine-hydrolyzing) [Hippea sp. KM1]
MCNILGYFNTKLSLNEIEKYNKRLSHRGPDASCVKEYDFKNKKLFLAHNRLAIQDLNPNANQPMENERFVIVFNGEIYNHFEIRWELSFRGFRTHSDTETLLWAFTEWGVEKAISKLNGMFAIALFDKQEQMLYLIRDRVGIKPLYWTFQHGEFVFSSELKGIRDELKTPDIDSLVKFVSLGYTPNDKSYYKNIYKLKPAHYLIFDGENIKIKRYWNLPKGKIDIGFDEAVEEVEHLLKDSVKKRLLADVEVGSFLSGGIDSSLVSAIMAEVSNKQIKTFTIGFKEEGYNEAEYAKKIAQIIGSEHYEYFFDAKDVLDLMDDLDYYYNEPFGDASALPMLLLSRTTKKRVTVALSGDGGDELFLGYDRYFFTKKYYLLLRHMPFKTLISRIFSILPNDKLEKMALPVKNPTYENLYSVLYFAIKPWQLDMVFNKDMLNGLDISFKGILEYSNNLKTIDDLSRLDFYRYLPDDILVKVDRATMAYSLEARVPILDHRIVEIAYKLPEQVKLTKGRKSILRKILYKYIPKDIVDRPKHGFSVPLKIWFRNELKELLFEKIKSLDGSIFNKKSLLNLFEKHQRGYNYEYLFWNLMRVK